MTDFRSDNQLLGAVEEQIELICITKDRLGDDLYSVINPEKSEPQQ